MSVLEGREGKDSSEMQSLWAQALITPVTSYEECDCRAFMTAVGWVANTSTTCLLLKTSLISSRKEALPCNSFTKLHTQCTNTVCGTGDMSFFFFFWYNSNSQFSFLTTDFELHTAILVEAGALFRLFFFHTYLEYGSVENGIIGSPLSPPNQCWLKQEYLLIEDNLTDGCTCCIFLAF